MKYENWSLGYWMLKQYIRFVDWIVHKEVILLGKENIPANKPLLIAPNHQNALADPMAILLHTKYQPVWLARADIFKNPVAAYILRFLKIMPVYRLRDGKDQLAKNDQTFSDSIKVLRNNKSLALFPEAAHSGKRQMLAHKKAVPRIVFLAEEKASDNLDIHIIPTGIYYSSYWKFNRSVLVKFGRPILVNDFLEEYKTSPNGATMAMRDALQKAIDPLTININSKEHYNCFELIRSIYGQHFLISKARKKGFVERFHSDQKLVRLMDKLADDDPDQIAILCNKVKEYEKTVAEKGLKSWLVENPEFNFWQLGLNKLILFLGLPVFLFGFIFNAIPFFTIDIITRKKIKDIAFWSTFYLMLGLILFPAFYLLELWILSTFLPGFWLKLMFLTCLPFSGKLAFRWYILFRKTWGRGRLFFMQLLNKKAWLSIKEEQKSLFALLDQKLKNAEL